MLVCEQLAVVIVLLLADAEQGECNCVIAGGLEVMHSPACFSGKAEIASNDGQRCGPIAPIWVIDGVEGVGVVGAPFRFLEAGVTPDDDPVDDRMDE